ncbi:hypothetical protein GJAV_G00265360, partial [Gymnothorax javanicus]
MRHDDLTVRTSPRLPVAYSYQLEFTTDPGLGAGLLRDLSANRISAVDANLFDRLTSLKELYLQGNRITNLPRGIFGCGPLSVLDISSNQISTLEERICDKLFNLTAINLSRNPFVCDCKLFRLLSWLQERGVNLQRAESVQCDRPLELRSQPVLNVSLLMC